MAGPSASSRIESTQTNATGKTEALGLVRIANDAAKAAGKRYAVRKDLATGNPSTSGCAVIEDLPRSDRLN